MVVVGVPMRMHMELRSGACACMGVACAEWAAVAVTSIFVEAHVQIELGAVEGSRCHRHHCDVLMLTQLRWGTTPAT